MAPWRIISLFLLLHTCILAQPSISVMSYNIRYNNPADGINNWDNRRSLVVSTIRFHEADIIGLQEAMRNQLDNLSDDMPEYAWFGVCRNDGTMDPKPDGEFSAILYRKDRFELLEGNTFWLSEHPDVVGVKGWDAALPRIVTWVKLKDKQSKKTGYFFNTHFDHMGESARVESAKLLLQKIYSIAGAAPVVLTGDFNCTAQEAPYKIITDDPLGHALTDAATIAKIPHHGPMRSFAGNFQIAGLEKDRIDFIFTKNKVSVLRHAVLTDNWNGRMASDHLPVFAEITLAR